MNDVVVEVEALRKSYQQAGVELKVLRGVEFRLGAGEIVALVAPSGAGKSTLLQLIGLLDRPDGGDVIVQGRRCVGLGDSDRTRIRRDLIGFVYQHHRLLPEFSAIENVIMPQIVAGASWSAAARTARDLLAALGLSERAKHYAGQLSGGEQQRVAIARALANRPAVLLADEPTGNLDPATAGDVFALLLRSVREAGAGALIATHNPYLAARMDRVVTLDEGVLTETRT